jgi:glutaredoxin 3
MSMPSIQMYCTATCPYCVAAEALLIKKGAGAVLEKIRVDLQPERRAEMQQRSGRHTVPQIWIGETHIGGCDDLHALESAGRLSALLNG